MNERLRYLIRPLEALIILGLINVTCVDGNIQNEPRKPFSEALRAACLEDNSTPVRILAWNEFQKSRILDGLQETAAECFRRGKLVDIEVPDVINAQTGEIIRGHKIVVYSR